MKKFLFIKCIYSSTVKSFQLYRMFIFDVNGGRFLKSKKLHSAKWSFFEFQKMTIVRSKTVFIFWCHILKMDFNIRHILQCPIPFVQVPKVTIGQMTETLSCTLKKWPRVQFISKWLEKSWKLTSLVQMHIVRCQKFEI